MAILNQTQLVAASNATYIDNTSGSITPTAVRTLNDSWISSSITVDLTSSMTVASASYAATASIALNFNPSATASYALQALNATNANNADQATFASTAGSANSAITASFALNFNPAATASFALFANTASYALNFNPTATASYANFAATASYFSGSVVNATSASYALTASYVANAQTASYVVNAVSASRAVSAANADTASFVTTAQTASYVVNAISASYASNADLLDNLNFTAFVLTSSFTPFSSSVSDRFGLVPTLAGNNTFTGNNIFGNVTASNALFTSASILNLSVIYETASVIYSSGSNQFGDAANDVQTLYGTVNIKTGPVNVSGSLNANGGVVGNLTGTASWSSNAVTASYVANAQTASYVENAQTASYVNTLNQDVRIIGGTAIEGLLAVTGGIETTDYVSVGGYLGVTAETYLVGQTNMYEQTFMQSPNSFPLYVSGTAVIDRIQFRGNPFNGELGSNLGAIRMDATMQTLYYTNYDQAKITTQSVIEQTVITASNYVETKLGADNGGQSYYLKLTNQSGTGLLNTNAQFTISGSVNGNVTSASIASNTASLNFSLGNFYTSLVSGSTNFNITNPKPGQTVNLLLTTVGVATASFSSNVKQVSGSAYTPTSGSGKNDILTFVSFDGTSVYLASVKNLI